jgi:spoIIIJ-associated protein
VKSQTDDLDPITAESFHLLSSIVKESGLEAEVQVAEEANVDVALKITGPDSGYFVGPHGQALDALQYLTTLVVNRDKEKRLRIIIDADGYRERRIQTLTKFAQTLAAEVIESNQEAMTDPLNPMERRIIHTALLDIPEVKTYSEGEDPHRYIVISPSVSQE